MEIRIKDRNKLRLMIARSGYSQRTFANEINVSQSYLSQLLSGKHSPSAKICYKIAKGLNKDVEEIFLIKLTDITVR